MKNRQKMIIPLIIVLMDLALIYWIFDSRIYGSVSLGLIYLMPIVAIFNLLIGLITFSLKIKYAFLFFVNIIVAPIVMVVVSYLATMYYLKYDLESKLFILNEESYYLDFDNKNSQYYIYSNLTGDTINRGTFIKFSKDTVQLEKGSYIVNDSLYNFPKLGLKIKLDSTYTYSKD